MKSSPSSQDKANWLHTGTREAHGWRYTHGNMGATRLVYSQSKLSQVQRWTDACRVAQANSPAKYMSSSSTKLLS